MPSNIVWVLTTYSPVTGHTLHGVYSSKDKAEEAIRKLNLNKREDASTHSVFLDDEMIVSIPL